MTCSLTKTEVIRPRVRKVTAKGQARKLRLLVYGMNYSPEIAGVGKYTGEIAEYLSSSGLEVTVITTPPHYPGWKTLPGYKNWYSNSLDGGVRVSRSPLLLRKKMGGLWRLIAPLSFAVSSSPVLVWRMLRDRYDVVLCVEPTLLSAPLAHLLAKLTNAATVLHVQDLEVDAAFAVGHLNSLSWLRSLGGLFERATLSKFNWVITISSKMASKLLEKGVQNSKLSVVRNWVDTDHIYPLETPNSYRRDLGFSDEDFIVLYSGNIGAKQGLKVLLEAAVRLKNETNVHFVIAGEGPAKQGLEREYGDLASVRFLPFQPYERLNEFLNMADLHALPQDKGAADLVLPSKVGGMLASGKPIIFTAEEGTELADFLMGKATRVDPGCPESLAASIRHCKQWPSHFPPADQTSLSLLSKETGLQSILSIVAQAANAAIEVS